MKIEELKNLLNNQGKRFYIMNLVNKTEIENEALENLLNRYDENIILNITNFDDIGVVEYVANNQFYLEELENNQFEIIIEED